MNDMALSLSANGPVSGVALCRPEASVRVHQTQPLFVAGQYLSQSHERHMILEVLRGTESDLGWATENRVHQLLNDWGWADDKDAAHWSVEAFHLVS